MGKVTAKVEAGPEKGRKAAYFARNRTALILATQELLGKKGWVATIEEVASNAEVSVSTVYQHFDSKEELFRACLLEAWASFESWALAASSLVKDPLEQLVVPMRLMFRASTTHPTYAQMLANSRGELAPMIPTITKTLSANLRQLLKVKVIEGDHPDIRINNLIAVILQIFLAHLDEPKSKAPEADLALALALPMLGISPAKAAAITTTPLPIDTSKAVI
jgi:AcrR family transcriptional regulator